MSLKKTNLEIGITRHGVGDENPIEQKQVAHMLNFYGGEFVEELIRSKTKLVTIRKADPKYDLPVGEKIQATIDNGSVITVVILYNRKVMLKDLTYDELWLDGYGSHEEALDDLKHYYPDMDMDSLVNCVLFLDEKIFRTVEARNPRISDLLGKTINEILEDQVLRMVVRAVQRKWERFRCDLSENGLKI